MWLGILGFNGLLLTPISGENLPKRMVPAFSAMPITTKVKEEKSRRGMFHMWNVNTLWMYWLRLSCLLQIDFKTQNRYLGWLFVCCDFFCLIKSYEKIILSTSFLILYNEDRLEYRELSNHLHSNTIATLCHFSIRPVSGACHFSILPRVWNIKVYY